MLFAIRDYSLFGTISCDIHDHLLFAIQVFQTPLVFVEIKLFNVFFWKRKMGLGMVIKKVHDVRFS